MHEVQSWNHCVMRDDPKIALPRANQRSCAERKTLFWRACYFEIMGGLLACHTACLRARSTAGRRC